MLKRERKIEMPSFWTKDSTVIFVIMVGLRLIGALSVTAASKYNNEENESGSRLNVSEHKIFKNHRMDSERTIDNVELLKEAQQEAFNKRFEGYQSSQDFLNEHNSDLYRVNLIKYNPVQGRLTNASGLIKPRISNWSVAYNNNPQEAISASSRGDGALFDSPLLKQNSTVHFDDDEKYPWNQRLDAQLPDISLPEAQKALDESLNTQNRLITLLRRIKPPGSSLREEQSNLGSSKTQADVQVNHATEPKMNQEKLSKKGNSNEKREKEFIKREESSRLDSLNLVEPISFSHNGLIHAPVPAHKEPFKSLQRPHKQSSSGYIGLNGESWKDKQLVVADQHEPSVKYLNPRVGAHHKNEKLLLKYFKHQRPVYPMDPSQLVDYLDVNLDAPRLLMKNDSLIDYNSAYSAVTRVPLESGTLTRGANEYDFGGGTHQADRNGLVLAGNLEQNDAIGDELHEDELADVDVEEEEENARTPARFMAKPGGNLGKVYSLAVGGGGGGAPLLELGGAKKADESRRLEHGASGAESRFPAGATSNLGEGKRSFGKPASRHTTSRLKADRSMSGTTSFTADTVGRRQKLIYNPTNPNPLDHNRHYYPPSGAAASHPASHGGPSHHQRSGSLYQRPKWLAFYDNAHTGGAPAYEQPADARWTTSLSQDESGDDLARLLLAPAAGSGSADHPARPAHYQVVHVISREEKKGHGKYLWPIVGGGLTMLMGFLIISNILLSIPLLAIGASSLTAGGSAGGGGPAASSSQLVPVYNLSQLIITTKAPASSSSAAARGSRAANFADRRRRRSQWSPAPADTGAPKGSRNGRLAELERSLERLADQGLARLAKIVLPGLLKLGARLPAKPATLATRKQVLKAAYCHRPIKIKRWSG